MKITTEEQAFQFWKYSINKALKDCKVVAEVSWDMSRKNAETRFLAILRVGKYKEMVVSGPFPERGFDCCDFWPSSPIWVEKALHKIAFQLLQDQSNETIRR